MTPPSSTDGYRRILLKLSGEALAGSSGDSRFGIDAQVLNQVCGEIAGVIESGTQLAIVIGGGNFFRGISASESGIERATADYIGMLATVMNSSPVSEPYVRLRALKHLNLGRVVIFAAGTGNPYFTTDTAASLRAAEINADILVKATKVDGVYDKDPVKFDDAKRFDRISYDHVLQQRLGVMDATAIALCRDNNMALRVLSIEEQGALTKLAQGQEIGTLISSS